MNNFALLTVLILGTYTISAQTFDDIFHAYDLSDIEGIEHGDFNGDGQPDFVLDAVQSGGLYVGINNNLATPQFTLISDEYFLTNIEVVDYDLDGDMDIFSSVPFDDSSIVWLNDGNANFTEELLPFWSYDAASFADLNGDGVMEAIIGHDDQVDIYNLTTSGLEIQSTIADDDPFRGGAGSIITLDYDSDGDLDIAGVFDRDGLLLFEQTSPNEYSEQELYGESFNNNELYAAELNGDGVFDFVVQSDFARNSHIILSSGGSGYTEERIPNPLGPNEFTTLADFDDDGNAEIIFTESDSPFDAEIYLVRINPDIEKTLLLDDHEAIDDGGVVDLDGDGDLDFYLFTNDRFDAGLVYFINTGGSAQVDADGDGSFEGDDCDDNDSTVFPGATEICDGKDNDCNGQVDDGLPQITMYADQDNDGYGDPDTQTVDCELGQGFVEVGDDCDDTDADIYPGAPEVLDNQIDEDCDGFDLSAIHELDDVSILIFPNPILDEVNIDISENIDYSVVLYDQKGSLLIKKENATSIIVGKLPSGIYLLKLTNLRTGKSIIERIIKK